jgi:hypothetical protein
MTADRSKAAKIQLVPEQLQETSAKWKQLPFKASSEPKIWNVVETMFNEILSLRTKGYSWEEICDLIEEDFYVKISPLTLQNYFREIQRNKKSKRGKRKPSKILEPTSTAKNSGDAEAKLKSKKQGKPEPQSTALLPTEPPAEMSVILKEKIETERLPFDIDQHLEENEVSSEDVVQNFEQIINQPLSENSSGSRTKRRSRFND